MLILQTSLQDDKSRQLKGFYRFDISLKHNYLSQTLFFNQMLYYPEIEILKFRVEPHPSKLVECQQDKANWGSSMIVTSWKHNFEILKKKKEKLGILWKPQQELELECQKANWKQCEITNNSEEF